MTSTVPRDYSLIAPIYDHVFHKLLNEGHQELGLLLKSKRKEKDFKVLEVGVGSGLTFDYLPSSIQYIGIDINEKMLSLARSKAERIKRKRISLSLMNAEKLRFKNSSFDMVIGASVITAVETPDLAMKEMIRVTKKGGHIALVANVRNSSYKSKIVKNLDPFTKKFLGFRTDIDEDYFYRFKNIKLVEQKAVNNVMGLSLSSFLLFQKL